MIERGIREDSKGATAGSLPVQTNVCLRAVVTKSGITAAPFFSVLTPEESIILVSQALEETLTFSIEFSLRPGCPKTWLFRDLEPTS